MKDKDSGRAAIDLMCALRVNASGEYEKEARVKLREMEAAAASNLKEAMELMEKKDYVKGMNKLQGIVRKYHGLEAAKKAAREMANYERNIEVRKAIRNAENKKAGK